MPDEWQTALRERLRGAATPEGAWAYTPGTSANAEPTALAVLALADDADTAPQCRRGCDWLASIQRPDGGVPVQARLKSPCWPTALALLAWSRCDAKSYHRCIQLAADYLLRTSGKAIHPDRAIGHDPTLAGWGWVQDTHSWVEPTAYAVLALRAAGHSDNARVKDGLRLLLDRALPDGGWNYGNTRVLEHTLRPFPATTGVALTALAGSEDGVAVRGGIAYLRKELPGVRAPMSLGWGLIALSAWSARPSESDQWLAEAARAALARPQQCAYDALLLLAAPAVPGWLRARSA